MSRIIIVTFSDNWFQSYGGTDKKFDVFRLIDLLKRSDINAELINIKDLKSASIKPDDYVFYSSSEVPEIREYIKDTLSLIRGYNLIPEFDLLLAHENKGYQALLARYRSIAGPETDYLFDVDSAYNIRKKPFVAKTVDGAGSSGVFLINNNRDLKKVREKISFSRYLKMLKKYIQIKVSLFVSLGSNKKLGTYEYNQLKASSFSNYIFKHKGFKRFVAQDFIKDLGYDYKVLVFGDRYYCLKRYTRKNDFRASGSGKFDPIKPSAELLDYCEEVKSKFDACALSLDVFEKDGFGLIEFQALNFGPVTIKYATNYYKKIDSSWNEYPASKEIEENYSYAISHYLKDKNCDR
jgi:glutathione synthase/RimK-type ligase-like ATP-grasp enzyme